LREYLGTENEKGDIKKLFSEPNKFRINSLTRKEKTTASNSGFAFTHPFGWTSINIMMLPQIAEKLTATDIRDSSAKEYSASEQGVQGSGLFKAPSNLNYNTSLNSDKRNNSGADSEELELYIQMRDKVLQEIIEHGLTKAQSKIFFYFYSLDRFGDRPIRAKVIDILRATKISRSVYYTALAKFKSMGWFRSPHPDVGISNYCTPTKKFRKQDSQSRKQDSQSRKQDSQSRKQDSQSRKQDSQSRKQDSETLKSLPAQVSKTPQTLQTYSNLLHTLSEDQRESFKKFCLKKIQECSFKIGSQTAWLNKYGDDYLQEFQETYSYALANPEVIPPRKAPFDIPDIPYLKRIYKDGWKDAAIHYGLIDPNSPEEEIQNESEPVASSEVTPEPIADSDNPQEATPKPITDSDNPQEVPPEPIADSDNPQEATPSTSKISANPKQFTEGDKVVSTEVGNAHHGQTDKINAASSSSEDKYTIALDEDMMNPLW
jgi:hypothetical protein